MPGMSLRDIGTNENLPDHGSTLRLVRELDEVDSALEQSSPKHA